MCIKLCAYKSLEFRLWLGEEDGSIDESAPPLHDGRVITETGCDNFVVRCNLRGKNKKTSNGNPRRRKSKTVVPLSFDCIFKFDAA